MSGECPRFSELTLQGPQRDCLFYVANRKINLDLMVGLMSIIICSIIMLCDYYFFIYPFYIFSLNIRFDSEPKHLKNFALLRYGLLKMGVGAASNRKS